MLRYAAIRTRWKAVGLCLLSTAVLFCGFQWNTWRVAEREWFRDHEWDGEAMVIGRLLESRQAGFFSAAGLAGVASPGPDSLDLDETGLAAQYAMYFQSRPCGAYTPYLSNPGGAGWLFGPLDQLLPLPPRERLEVMHGFNSLLTATALALIVLWFYREFGLGISLGVLGSAVLAPWLTVFGRNLYWCLWSFYVPLIAAMYFLQRNSSLAGRRATTWALVVFAAIAVKCVVTGFEYITTVLVTPLVPWVYYCLRRRSSIALFLRGSLAAGLGAAAAVAVSLAILCAQISVVQGGLGNGVAHIHHALVKRTYADAGQFPALATSLSVSPAYVLQIYLGGTFFDANNVLAAPNSFVRDYVYRVRYAHVVAVFILATAVMALRNRRRPCPEARRMNVALALACWFSALAPLSWFVIFKAHSYVHTQMNFVVWQMPFTLFGFALAGLALRSAISRQPA